MVEKLLEKSPNINTVDKDGMTALFIACKEGYQGTSTTNLVEKILETNPF